MTQESHDHESVAELEGGKLVPVAEAIRYRRRAQQAESQIESYEQRLNELQSQVEQQNEKLGEVENQKNSAQLKLVEIENRMLTEQALTKAGAIDVEAASILLGTTLDMSEMLTADDVNQAVNELLRKRPYMRAVSAGAMPGMTQSPQSSVTAAGELSGAAKKAAASGNRKDIAEYLRLRRQYATMP